MLEEPTIDGGESAHVLHPSGKRLEKGRSATTIGSLLINILTRYKGSKAQDAEEGKEIVPPPPPLAHKAEHY